ncbi:MAG TPA: ATP-dependent DNA ligase [Polyangiaceae bacterium]
MRFADLVETSRRVAATRSRLEKVAHLSAFLRQLSVELVGVGTSYLAGDLPQGKLGIGYAVLHGLRQAMPAPASEPTLELTSVDHIFAAIKAEGGSGSGQRRAALLSQLLTQSTAEEQDFALKLVIGEVRQGALESLMIDAVARAFDASSHAVRRAVMLAGGLPPVATALAREGPAGLSAFELRLFQPIQPMLADTAEDVESALERLGEAALEYKLDGARVQVHKDGDQVEVYSRQLRRVTPAVPEIVERVRALPARRLVLDGEAIVLSPAGRPQSFQVTMRRFGRKLDVDSMRKELPLDVRFFDILRLDDDTLLTAPLGDRWQALISATGIDALVPRIVTANAEEADAFLTRALGDGHEGVMAKNVSAAYNAGRRGQDWLKLKTAHSFDLVVLAAEWGSGRRRGWLSNLHLGARDPDNGGFVMLGKTFKGMTDEVLRWQTDALVAREIARDSYTVYVRPELVVEIAFNDVQHSSQYPGGAALRFARLKRYRSDKSAADANTIADVRALLPSR